MLTEPPRWPNMKKAKIASRIIPAFMTQGAALKRLAVSLLCAALVGSVAQAEPPRTVPPARDLAQVKPLRFDVHEKDIPDQGVPIVLPRYTIKLDPAYRGGWLTVGDLTGDGVAELVSAKNAGPLEAHFTSSVVAHRLDGSVLWKWGNPEARNNIYHDVACQIYDLDGDGRNEVVIAADRKVVVLDGATGRENKQFPIPARASDCIRFCNISGKKRPTDMLVKTRYDQIWAYDAGGRLLWTSRKPGGYRTAHQPFAVDLDGDGRDEIMAGFAMLNSDGSVRWTIPSANSKPLQGHADSIRLFRSGPRPEDKRLLVTHCGGNRMTMLDGNGRMIWCVTGLHFESVFFGKLDPDLPGRQLVVDICHQPWGQQPLLILDERGALLGRYITARSRQHRLVDWFGTGMDLIFCGQTRALLNANGEKVARFETPMPEGADPSERGSDPLRYMVHLADVNADGRPDLVLSTVPGSAVWIYENGKGPKGLDPSRLVLPVNATLY